MFFSKIGNFIYAITPKTVLDKVTDKKFWIKLLTVALAIVVLITCLNAVFISQCRTIGGRDIFFGLTQSTVNFKEHHNLVRISLYEITDVHSHLMILPIDVFKHYKKVNYYGYQADIYYVFWYDELTWVYFFINNGSTEEMENTRNDINSKLQNEFDGSLTNGVFEGIPKRFATLFDGQINDIYSFLAPSPSKIETLEFRSAAYTTVESGKNYFPTDKKLWEALTEQPYQSLIDENTIVVEYSYRLKERDNLNAIKGILYSLK